ncbi:hypothetical protein H5410_030964, partial [Solanum commersonii]
MVTIYQFKPIKEKHLIMLDQAIMEGILSCKFKLHKVWPHQVKLSCKHTLMPLQVNLWKFTISQSKAIHEFYYLKLPCM